MKISLIKLFTILLFTITASTSHAQSYFCIFDSPEAKNIVASIPSDKFVNDFGDLLGNDIRVENEVFSSSDLVKRSYYKGDILIAQRNYTINGELISDEAGISIYEYEYNANNQITQITYFDEEKEAAQAAYAGPAMIRYEYDTNGNKIKASYFNKYYELLDLGVSIIEYTYDNENRLALEKHFDASNNLVEATAPIIKYSYDDNGQMVQQSFLNAENQTVTRLMDDDDYDIARIAYEYEGEMISMMHYYNIKGELLGSEKGQNEQ